MLTLCEIMTLYNVYKRIEGRPASSISITRVLEARRPVVGGWVD